MENAMDLQFKYEIHSKDYFGIEQHCCLNIHNPHHVVISIRADEFSARAPKIC